jgi:hypothetical protein
MKTVIFTFRTFLTDYLTKSIWGDLHACGERFILGMSQVERGNDHALAARSPPLFMPNLHKRFLL